MQRNGVEIIYNRRVSEWFKIEIISTKRKNVTIKIEFKNLI